MALKRRSRGPAGPAAGWLSLPLLALLEPIDAALGIDDPLLAAEEWMAHRADLGFELFLRRAGHELIAAQAGHDGVMVVGRMDGGFHGQPILSTHPRWQETVRGVGTQNEQQQEDQVEPANHPLG